MTERPKQLLRPVVASLAASLFDSFIMPTLFTPNFQGGRGRRNPHKGAGQPNLSAHHPAKGRVYHMLPEPALEAYGARQRSRAADRAATKAMFRHHRRAKMLRVLYAQGVIGADEVDGRKRANRRR